MHALLLVKTPAITPSGKSRGFIVSQFNVSLTDLCCFFPTKDKQTNKQPGVSQETFNIENETVLITDTHDRLECVPSSMSVISHHSHKNPQVNCQLFLWKPPLNKKIKDKNKK